MARKTKTRKAKIMDIARTMPPLFHKPPNQDFDCRKSYVIKWLLKHDEAYDYLWNMVKASGAIEYDPDTGTWKGVDFDT